MTIFDDGAFPDEERQSRALVLDVDTVAMSVTLRRAYTHPAGFVAANQGSVQLLPNGRVFVGWGNQPYFSEFAADGALLFDGEFHSSIRSYRAYTRAWRGRPTRPPDVAARGNTAGGSIVYASWNGATDVRRWLVTAGSRPDALVPVGSQEWTGFETSIAVNAAGPYFAVTALDQDGRDIGHSRVVAINASVAQ